MATINTNDYLLDQGGFDWDTLLAGWSGILPETFTLWLVNRFGDLFVIVEDGAVYFLQIATGEFTLVAESQDQFAVLMDVPRDANNWLLIPVVDQCLAAGMQLQHGKCYGFKVPLILGGNYGMDNVFIADLSQNYGFLAGLWSQTKDLADGSQVRLVIGAKPEEH